MSYLLSCKPSHWDHIVRKSQQVDRVLFLYSSFNVGTFRLWQPCQTPTTVTARLTASDSTVLLGHQLNCTVTASGCWSQSGDYCTQPTNSAGLDCDWQGEWRAVQRQISFMQTDKSIHCQAKARGWLVCWQTHRLMMAVSEKMSHLSWDHLTVIRTSNYSWPLPSRHPPPFKT